MNVGYHQNKSIAVVDDEEDIVTLFIEVLKENGYYHVMGFTNPLFILDYIREYPDKFALIIIDYKMSPMHGCELSSKIPAIYPKIKMILITAYDDIKNNDLNLEVVKKPISVTKLLQIIQQQHLN